ncbi:SAM-dependent methyltransferase [Parachlamydia acanthamoebae]|jgi:SAM-dependent methyltransferase|uniref:SAM-dependent methyltransferase n=1 Tax=Parachlamydia acanthamoebae TaxID=83552 RepID=UPI0024E1CE39|nr:class I SAM-dependent methyltransferase [Parachlamydia acanthamoebae]
MDEDSDTYWQLLKLNFKVKYRNFKEFCAIVRRFYKNRQFCQCDLLLLREYLWQNPFAISKKFLIRHGEKNVHAYGETPLTSLAKIAEACQITPKDVVYELGCGRGRGCFWLHCFYQCRVVGIDFVPSFIQKAEKVRKRCDLEAIDFRCEDMSKSDFSGGTVFYLYGTCLEDSLIKKLIKKFKQLPSGTKIMTVSYPLSDYSSGFNLHRTLSVPFTWGEGIVYIQEVKKSK